MAYPHGPGEWDDWQVLGKGPMHQGPMHQQWPMHEGKGFLPEPPGKGPPPTFGGPGHNPFAEGKGMPVGPPPGQQPVFTPEHAHGTPGGAYTDGRLPHGTVQDLTHAGPGGWPQPQGRPLPGGRQESAGPGERADMAEFLSNINAQMASLAGQVATRALHGSRCGLRGRSPRCPAAAATAAWTAAGTYTLAAKAQDAGYLHPFGGPEQGLQEVASRGVGVAGDVHAPSELRQAALDQAKLTLILGGGCAACYPAGGHVQAWLDREAAELGRRSS